MEQLTVALPGRAYDILIERGLLNQAGTHCAPVLPAGCRIAVVTDSIVGPLYGDRAKDALNRAGFQAKLFTVPAGEFSKQNCLRFPL